MARDLRQERRARGGRRKRARVDDLITLDIAAELLGLSCATDVHRLIKRGALPSVKIQYRRKDGELGYRNAGVLQSDVDEYATAQGQAKSP